MSINMHTFAIIYVHLIAKRKQSGGHIYAVCTVHIAMENEIIGFVLNCLIKLMAE